MEETTKGRGGLPRWAYAALACALWALLGLWYALTPSPEFIERYYSRGVYPLVARTVTAVTGLLPFSLALILVVGIVAGFFILWAGNWVRLRRRGGPHWRGLLWGPKWALVLVPFINLWFLFFWGIGYQREPIEARLGLDTARIEDAESDLLRAQLLAVIERDQPRAPEDRDVTRAVAAVAKTMAESVAEWDGRPVTVPARVKATPPGLLLFNRTSGICLPLTLEPHVDGGLPDTAFVSVAAHELGHIAGLCGEAEATLAGFVAGMRADDPYARYAVALDMYLDLARSLRGEEARAAIQALPEVARADMQAAREASDRYRVEWFAKASWKVYDRYLQSQGIAEGVKNYARGISLFVYLWRDGRADFNGLSAPPRETASAAETAGTA
jgi:hypothetical protein